MNMLYIYAIGDDKSNVKVGITNNPNRRLKAIQTGHPEKLHILFTEEFNCSRNHILKIESKLHKELSTQYKKQKGEWFLIPESKLESLKNHIIYFRIRYEEDEVYFSSRHM